MWVSATCSIVAPSLFQSSIFSIHVTCRLTQIHCGTLSGYDPDSAREKEDYLGDLSKEDYDKKGTVGGGGSVVVVVCGGGY